VSDSVRIALVVGGIGAVLIAVVWRTAIVGGRRRRLRDGLRAEDPQDRARAGILLVDEGLHRSAGALLAHVASEPDPRVCHAIALAVARRQWEPVDTLRVRQLREWASQELERRGADVQPFGPAVTRLSDMGGPRPPDAQERQPPVEPVGAADEHAGVGAPTVGGSGPPPPPDPAVRWHLDPPSG
jgi:hypothetical protein